MSNGQYYKTFYARKFYARVIIYERKMFIKIGYKFSGHQHRSNIIKGSVHRLAMDE